MSHSKRNTSRAVFTAHERDLARRHWSVTHARLTADSFLPFGACALCLHTPADDPVVCPEGDLFCRGCAVQNILTQKQEHKRRRQQQQAREEEEREEEKREEEERRQKEIDDFGKLGKGLKRKREDTRHESSFWVLAPSSNRDAVLHAVPDREKKEPQCPAGDHAYSLRELTSVHWGEGEEHVPSSSSLHPSSSSSPPPPPPSTSSSSPPSCPACNKTLTNASRAVLARPCGHVVCGRCADAFVRPQRDAHAEGGRTRMACFVCGSDLEGGDEKDGEGDEPERETKKSKKEKKEKKKEQKKGKPGLVTLRSQGTGFSAGGASEVTRSSVSFQC